MATPTEIAKELLPELKTVVRVTDDAFDFEVETLAASAVSDMLRCGVGEECFDKDSEANPMCVAAIMCYCKAHFGGDNPNAEMDFFGSSYRQHVCDLLNSANNVAAGGDDALE